MFLSAFGFLCLIVFHCIKINRLFIMTECRQQLEKGNGNAKKESKDSKTNLKPCLGLPYSFEW